MAQDPRITLLEQTNAGVAAARNHGIQIAEGTFVAPIDADDLWKPTKIERQVERFLASDNKLALVYTGVALIDEESRTIQVTKHPPNFEGRILDRLIEGNFVTCGSAPLMRKDYVLDVGGYDPKLRARNAQGCEDWKLSLRLAERYEFATVQDFLVGYRQSSGMMSRNFQAMKRSHDLVLDDVRRRHPEAPEENFQRSATLYTIWLVNRNISALKLLWPALRNDRNCLMSPTVMKRLLWIPVRHLYLFIILWLPGLGLKLEELSGKDCKPFLDSE